jgi:Ca-activated chloride channel homolog
LNFSSPNLLYLLLCLPLLAWALRKAHHVSSLSYPKVSALISLQSQRKTSWLEYYWALELCSLGLLIIALADPQESESFSKDIEEGIAIELVVDVSSSMDINMKTPNGDLSRLEAAKNVIENFVLGDGQQLQGRKNDLVGLISFSRYADTLCPLTLSHEALVSMTNDMTVNETPNEDGTAYGDATALAAAQLNLFGKKISPQQKTQTNHHVSKIIVLLTDGENNCGLHLPLQAAAMALEWGVKIYAISLGDLAPTKKFESQNGSHSAQSSMDQNAWILKQMAEATGGIYRHTHDYHSLYSVYQEIDQLEIGQIQTKSLERKKPIFHLPACLSLALLALSFFIRCWGSGNKA